MAHGSCMHEGGFVHGSLLMAHGSWFIAHARTRVVLLMAHGSWLTAHGSWLMLWSGNFRECLYHEPDHPSILNRKMEGWSIST